jgi:hypothetical protein
MRFMAVSRRLFPDGVNTVMQNVCRPVPACRNAGTVHRRSHRSEALSTPASRLAFVLDACDRAPCRQPCSRRMPCSFGVCFRSCVHAVAIRDGARHRTMPKELNLDLPGLVRRSVGQPQRGRAVGRTHVGEKAPRSSRSSVGVALSRRCRNERPSTFAGPPGFSPASRVRLTLRRSWCRRAFGSMPARGARHVHSASIDPACEAAVGDLRRGYRGDWRARMTEVFSALSECRNTVRRIGDKRSPAICKWPAVRSNRASPAPNPRIIEFQ